MLRFGISKAFLVYSVMTLSIMAHAWECQQYEAQVAGTISKIEFSQNEDSLSCQYQIRLNYYSGHIRCPISSSEIENASIKHPTSPCLLKLGDSVSGILVLKNSKLYWD